MSRKQKKLLTRIVIAAVLMIVLAVIPFPEGVLWVNILRFFLYLIPYFIVGFDILKKAWKGILNRQVFDEQFLMSVATIGAMAIAIYSDFFGMGDNDYTEAIAVMLFYQIGEFFQSYAIGKSRKNISELMDIRPDSANLEGVDGSTVAVDPDDVEVGSVIVVRPGEKIPIDGVVVEGISTLNTSALTGESLPRDVAAGDSVLSGCVNLTGILRIRTEKEFGESTVSKILEMVENATSLKSRSENFISKFARYYTPVVCYSALALAIIPPAALTIAGQGAGLSTWMTWIYRALTFLVISCPCALVASIPLSFFAGIGGAGHEGILVKGSNYLEALSKVKYAVFDKTGTVTEGRFEVSSIVRSSNLTEEEMLYYAAHAESYSLHPIAVSLQKAYGNLTGQKPVDQKLVGDLEEIGGNGVLANIGGKAVSVGNNKLMARIGIRAEAGCEMGTIVHLAVEDTYAGYFIIVDKIKENAEAAMRGLKRAGVKKTVMLTGDTKSVADFVASKLGIDEVYSELLPADKVSIVEKLLAQKKENEVLAFAGDGMNDAPVLGRADVGIAMGMIGSDAAIEAADIVLMDDDPAKIVKAIRIARKCMRIVYENTYFAIGVKFICLILGAAGIANMWLAIFADVGVMVLAVMNAIRALFVKRL